MTRTNNTPSWLVYERCVAAFTAEQHDDLEVIVQPNVNIVGHLSGVERQIDVLVDSRWSNDLTRRIIIDAKERTRKLDVKDVEAFEGMMRDCQASQGVIVCTSGYSGAAFRRAQEAITITMLTVDELDQYDWVYEPCLGECRDAPGIAQHRGMVLWAAYMGVPTNGLMHIFQTGKCDGCHSFHVWCWECGSKFVVPDSMISKCPCGHDWIAWPDAEDKAKSHCVQLMLRVSDEYGAIIDRRPIR